MKRIISIALTMVLLLGMMVIGAAPAAGASVEPTYVEGNPTPTGLGYDFGVKLESPGTGTYTVYLDAENYVTLVIGTDPDENGHTYLASWTSTIPLDAIIMKGGDGANVYVYDPESLGDINLYCPDNSSGYAADISHIDIAYDYEVTVEKTAVTSYTRTYEWDIDKTVSPEIWDIFVGDSATSTYTVSVEKTATDSDWAVAGMILITNDTPFPAQIASVIDMVDDIPAIVTPLPPYFILPPDGAIRLWYETPLPGGSNRINTATVATEFSPEMPVHGNTGTADVIFGEPTNIVGPAAVNVDDSNGLSWYFTDSGYATYDATFTGAGTYDNTATIRETGQSDGASVTVNVYELDIADAASADFTRYYTWTIDKSADASELLLTAGQVYTVNYEVTVDATYVDADYVVTGTLTINNPAPIDAVINSVTISGAGVATAFEAGPYTIPAGESLTIPYELVLGEEAVALSIDIVQQNYDYDADGTANLDGTNGIAGASAVDYGAAEMADEVDETIVVTDTNVGYLGTVNYSDLPVTFGYPLPVGPYELPGTYQVDNTASFVTNDTETPGSDDWTVIITVPQTGVGATLTQGYWKTHSSYGPAPYDETWALIGEDTPFFDSGYTYYDILWTPPKGDPYINLAVQYIAAQLNFLNGADPTDAQEAFDAATALLSSNTPSGKLKGPEKAQFIELASILDDYNNGVIGPGHADE